MLVTLLVILAVCIIMFISNFGIGGFVGEKVSGFCFGLFGMMAYLFPICFFVGAAFFVSNKDNGIAIVKLTAGVVFVVFLCLFMELIAGDSKEYQVQKSFQYAVEHKSGGGAAGGLLASLLCPAIGVANIIIQTASITKSVTSLPKDTSDPPLDAPLFLPEPLLPPAVLPFAVFLGFDAI